MRDCAWPHGCFQVAEPDDPDGCCGYHRKVLDGLIATPIPGVPEMPKPEAEVRDEPE